MSEEAVGQTTAVDTATDLVADGDMTAATDVSPAPRSGPGSMLRPLRLRDFRLLFTGETISLIGDQFHFVALAWLALELTGSGLALGSVLLVAGLPRMFLVLVGGALADRISPRSVMLVSNASRMVVVGALAILVISGRVEFWMLYPFALFFGAVDAFFWPAQGTIVPMLVDEGDLPAANGLTQGSQQLTGLLGPAIAGLFVAAAGTGWAFGIDAATFAVAALALYLIVGGRRPASNGEEQPGMLRTIGTGVAYAWRDPAIRSLLLLSAALNFAFTGPVTVGLAWLANSRFDAGASGFGFMLAAFGAGALAGAIVAGSLGRVRELGWVTLGMSFAVGLLLGLVGLAPSVLVVMAIAALIGVGIGFVNVRIVAWLQARTPDEMIGRVMSLAMMGGVLMSPISLAVAGVLVDVGAATPMYVGAGALVVVTAVAGVLWGVPEQMREA
jgi:MFS family permease